MATHTLRLCLHPGLEDAAIIISDKSSSARTISHESLRQNVENLQHELAQHGIGHGTRVSIVLSDPNLFILTFFSVTLQGSVVAPLNHDFKSAEFEYYYKDLGVEWVVLSAAEVDNKGYSYNVAKRLGIKIAICNKTSDGEVALGFLNERKTGQASAIHEPDQDDLALILHTSGTTGKPKAVPLTHGNLARSTDTVVKHYSLSSSDRAVVIMPLFHIHGLVAGLFAPLAAGGAIIFAAKGGLTPSFHKDAIEHKATWYTATPTLHKLAAQILVQHKPAFRFVRSCSSRLEEAVLHDLETLYGCPVVEAYAMTETAHQMCSNPVDKVTRRIGSVGKATGIDLKILDETGKEQARGSIGEVCVKGANVARGYLDSEDANINSFSVEGFFRTGDLGRLSSDGYLTLTGRIKEQINKGGEKISPVEIDEVINRHSDIAEAATFTMPDEMYGENVAIAVVPRQGKEISESGVRDYIAKHLAQSKVPRKVFLVEKIPKTAVGKLQRKLVAETLL